MLQDSEMYVLINTWYYVKHVTAGYLLSDLNGQSNGMNTYAFIIFCVKWFKTFTFILPMSLISTVVDEWQKLLTNKRVWENKNMK